MKIPTIIVSILIIIVVLIPGSNLPSVNFFGFDKIVHIGLFGLWAVAVRYDFNSPKFKFSVAFSFGILFSICTEVLQLLVEGRSFDLFDMVADAIGLIGGFLASGFILKLLGKTTKGN